MKHKKIVIYLLSILMVLGLMPSNTKTVSAQDEYEAYSTEQDGFELALNARLKGSKKEEVVYCFNAYKDAPAKNIAVEPNTYTKVEGKDYEFDTSAKLPRLKGKALEDAVKAVIFNGYPLDGSGLKKAYQLNDGAFRKVTQNAVWYFTDSESSDDPHTHMAPMLLNQEREVFERLINPDLIIDGEKTPENLRLNFYLNQGGLYQDLIGTTFNVIPGGTAKIKKTDASGELLPDAELVLLDSTGKEVEHWQSKAIIKPMILPSGTYTLREITAPNGYVKAKDITFVIEKDGTVKLNGTIVSDSVITMVDEDSQYPVKFKKTDIGGKELPGAKITVTGDNGVNEEWISTETPKELSLRPGFYKMTEVIAPEGYEIATSIDFQIQRVGSIIVNQLTVIKDGVIVMKDDYVSHKVPVSKVDIAGKGLAGAELSILDNKGKEVSRWISTDVPRELNLKPGEYTLKEISAPAGYAEADNITFTVDVNGTVMSAGKPLADNTVKMIDGRMSKVKFRKIDIAGAELPGAKISVTGAHGVNVEWTSAATPKELDLKPGKYTMTEVIAPEGYAKATSIEFELLPDGLILVGGKTIADKTIVMKDELLSHKVNFSKTDVAGKELPGAKLSVIDAKGNIVENWESTDTPKVIELTAGGYKMIENLAPLGYDVATEISFTVNLNGTVSIGTTTMPNNTIVMQDQLTKRKVNFSKTDVAGKELPGATLSVVDAKGNVIENWKSTSTPKVIELTAGEYKMIENLAPVGYDVATEISFTVNLDGTVKVGTTTMPNNTIVMQDKLTKRTVNFSKTDIDGKELPGAELSILDSRGKIVKHWTSTNTPMVIELGAGDYTMTEVLAPLGYDVATDISFTVKLDGTVVVENKATTNNTVVMLDQLTKRKSNFSKTDVNGVAIQGAELSILDSTGKTIQHWTTKSTSEEFDLVAGEYTLVETFAPEGYEFAKPIKFTVSATGTIVVGNDVMPNNTLVMQDKFTKRTVNFSKTDINGKELPGAKIMVIDARGNVVEQWISTDTPKTLELGAGRYTMIEDLAPLGYDVATSIKFTVNLDGTVNVGTTVMPNNTLVMQDQLLKRDVYLSKTDINGKELPGAKLSILNSQGAVLNNWISSDAPMLFQLPMGEYTMVEDLAPLGYDVATNIKFTVNPDGTVSVGGTTVANNTVVMKDALTERKVTFSKTDIDGKELPEAELAIKDEKGKIVKQWTSTNTPMTFELVAGKYTMVETLAPVGYDVATSIEFTVNMDGTVNVGNKVVPGNVVVMNDQLTKRTVNFSKTDVDGKELPGAELKVTDAKGNVVEQWISADTPKVLELVAGKYMMTENLAPVGYDVATSIEFTVNMDGTVNVGNKVVPGN
ncbi:MAG: SpaA isopeptide-forming pilin-related protein, partial [Culicoidibacterales bacterium]